MYRRLGTADRFLALTGPGTRVAFPKELVREMREKRKSLARLSLRAAGNIEARIGSGELGVALRHDVEHLRNTVEVLKDAFEEAKYLDPESADQDLRELVDQLETRVAAFEERVAAGRPN